MEEGYALLMPFVGCFLLGWGWYSLKTKEVYQSILPIIDKKPLRGRLTVQFFGRLVGGSGLLMLLSLIAAVISGDGSYLEEIFKVGFLMFLVGWVGAGIIEYILWVYECYPYDGSAEQDAEFEESDSRKRKRKRAQRESLYSLADNEDAYANVRERHANIKK